jgi:GTPase SAR1 family protein
MKLGIIGLPGSGKTTVFEALSQAISDIGKKKGPEYPPVVFLTNGWIF